MIDVVDFALAVAQIDQGPNDGDDIFLAQHAHGVGCVKIETHVHLHAADGGQIVVGGKRAADRPEGNYYPATVIADCRQDMAIVREEIFGPVMPVVKFHDLDEAIAWANDSIYGLASSIFTKEIDVAMRACNELRFGETYVNRENMENMQGFHAGWRKSGIGGADGKHGVLEYTRTHVVYLQYDMAAGRS